MPLIPPKPPTRRPGLGAAKLLLAAMATGVGASLLFHSTVGSPPALVQPATPEAAVTAPTVQAEPSAVAAAEPGVESSAPATTAAEQAATGPGKQQPRRERDGEPRTALNRSIDPTVGQPAEQPVPAQPLVPEDPAPVEKPEPAAEAPGDSPAPPVELPPQERASGDAADPSSEGTAPLPAPAPRTSG